MDATTPEGATFDSAENAALVAAELNERSNRSTLDAMVDPWVVTDAKGSRAKGVTRDS